MLFVLLPGGRAVSNHPEEFGGRGPDPGETPKEQTGENSEGRALLVPHIGYSTVHVPDVGQMRIVERRLDLGTLHVIAGAGEPLVLAEITRISRLVDDLLVLAQAERTDFLRAERVDMRPFVTDLWDGVSLTADRRLELGTIADGSLYADPDRVAQALRNLARNAIEHAAEPDGLVRLDVTPLASDRVCFAVLDDGPGIPRHERDRVFERFHRTDSGRSRSNGGAGLGLAIVRAIAESHGGTVRVRDSNNGRGAAVEFVLPSFHAA